MGRQFHCLVMLPSQRTCKEQTTNRLCSKNKSISKETTDFVIQCFDYQSECSQIILSLTNKQMNKLASSRCLNMLYLSIFCVEISSEPKNKHNSNFETPGGLGHSSLSLLFNPVPIAIAIVSLRHYLDLICFVIVSALHLVS